MLHPDYLPLTATQLAEWEAFERIDPDMGQRMDTWMGILMSGITNLALAMNVTKGEAPKYTNPSDFIPEWGETPEEYAERKTWKERRLSTEQLKQQLMTWARSHNRALERKQRKEG